jgi:hypothetical protein
VAAIDPFGQPVRDYSLELRNRKGAIIELGRGGHSFRAVPFGEYTLVAITDCCRSERDLIVNVPSMWVRLGVPIRFGDRILPGGDLIVRGIIHAIPRISGDKWVRVRGVFLDFSREVEIASDGRFSGSEREFDEGLILRGFLESDEFGLGGGQALCLQQ